MLVVVIRTAECVVEKQRAFSSLRGGRRASPWSQRYSEVGPLQRPKRHSLTVLGPFALPVRIPAPMLVTE